MKYDEYYSRMPCCHPVDSARRATKFKRASYNRWPKNCSIDIAQRDKISTTFVLTQTDLFPRFNKDFRITFIF